MSAVRAAVIPSKIMLGIPVYYPRIVLAFAIVRTSNLVSGEIENVPLWFEIIAAKALAMFLIFASQPKMSST